LLEKNRHPFRIKVDSIKYANAPLNKPALLSTIHSAKRVIAIELIDTKVRGKIGSGALPQQNPSILTLELQSMKSPFGGFCLQLD
jgi:hypothetical protein